MNTPRKNHDIFSCQEAPTPRNEVEVLALKSVLLYCLKCFLASQYEEEEGGFIEFLHNRKAHGSSEPVAIKNKKLNWHRIPLQKRYDSPEVLYVSALPQLFEKALPLEMNSDNGVRTAQEITHCFTKRLQVFQLQPLINDSFFPEETLSVFSNLWQSFKIETERSGWISFRLSNRGICTWINQLQNISHLADSDHTLVIRKLWSKPAENNSILHSVSQKEQRYAKAHIDELIWQAQYTHARCCSLMRSWNLISMRRGPGEEDQAPASQAGDISALTLMLDAEKTTPTHQLMQALIETADDMFWLPEQYPHKQYFLLLKRAEQLTLAFERFHSAHALIPVASRQCLYPTLLTSTRNLMKALLHSYLQVPVPSQL